MEEVSEPGAERPARRRRGPAYPGSLNPLARLLIAVLALALLAPAAASAAKDTKYHLSLGDSYAQGVQPLGPGQADRATNKGYTDFLHPLARKRISNLKLVKLGCGGATTESLIKGTRPCGEKLPYKSTSAATSQLTYAEKFMREHKGRIALVTISISGNDVAPCATAGDTNAVLTCVTTGLESVKKNLATIAGRLRSAAGSKAIIIGSTYPDVVLGQYIKGESGRGLATASVQIFRDQLNPTLKSGYAKKKIRFVDATVAFGGYIPFETTTDLPPFGAIPTAVANICTLAWYCEERPQGPDIHLRTKGYEKMADLYYSELKKALK